VIWVHSLPKRRPRGGGRSISRTEVARSGVAQRRVSVKHVVPPPQAGRAAAAEKVATTRPLTSSATSPCATCSKKPTVASRNSIGCVNVTVAALFA
jgi:hypothetical protein